MVEFVIGMLYYHFGSCKLLASNFTLHNGLLFDLSNVIG
jgi:hypothetical protein